MKKTAIQFGLLSGIIIIIYSALVFLVFGDFSSMSTSDLSMVETLGYLRYIILLLTIIFALRFYKKQNPGTSGFKNLFLAGLYTALVVGLMVGLMEMVYFLVNPDFFDQYGALAQKNLVEKGASAEELAKHEKQMQDYKWMANPAVMGIWYFFETFIIGTIVACITALLMKNPRPRAAMA